MTRHTTGTRSTASLDGEWTFATDPDGVGVDEGWTRPDASWPDTETVTVPASWQEQDAYRDYTGVAWYRRRFEYDGDGDRCFLRFGAVDYETTVFLDGEEVGHNRGGYLPFECDVTDALDAGEHVLTLRVEDPENLREIPHGKQGEPWYTRVSGPWQSVTLETRPATYVADCRARPDLSDDTVRFEVEADSATDAAELDAEVAVTRDGDAVATETCELVDGRGTATIPIPDADYWTPDRPALYDLTVTLADGEGVVDEYHDYFGMRSIDHDGEHLLLNGEPCYVRGALDQAYYPETLYRPFEDGLFEREIELAKEMGFNLIRKHIKPPHPDFVEAADRLGVLVWSEPANPDDFTERSKGEVREQLRGLIDRDYNSPSVIAWSLYNEEWGIGLDQRDYSDHPGRLWNDEEKQDYLAALYETVREWDDTRLLCDNSGWAHVATDLNDYHEYYVSPDRDGAWDEGLDEIVAEPEDNYATPPPEGSSASSIEETPILVSEFGTWGFTDPTSMRERYDGDPPWFAHDFLDDPLRRPEGVDDRFAGTDLPDVFEDYAALSATWQQRQMTSLKAVIERMRTDDAIAGYIVTEFSDIEWEFNGLLDYEREPKSIADEFGRINGDVAVVVEPSGHVVAPGEELTVDVRVVNDTNESLDGNLHWDGIEGGGTVTAAVDPFGTTTVAEGLPVVPAVDADSGVTSLDVTFEADDRTVENTEPIAVVAPGDPPEKPIYAPGALGDALAARGATVTDDLDAAAVAVVTTLDDAVQSFVERGNDALLVPGPDGRMVEEQGFDYRNLPASESWNLVAALLYHDEELLADICPGRRVGWAFEDLFPYDLAADLDDADDVLVGSVEGWLANWGSPLVVSPLGDGHVCRCTFRVTEAYGDHPTATTLVDRLLDRL